MSEEIRITRAPLEHGTAVLVAALMRRLGQERVVLTEDELRDQEVVAHWDYSGGTVALEAER